MLKLMDKKIFIILLLNFLFILSYEVDHDFLEMRKLLL